MSNISIYPSLYKTKQGRDITIFDFLNDVRNGRWQDEVLIYRTLKYQEAKKEAKLKLPAVTVSGSFSERKDSGLRKHSNYICIDIDDVENIEGTRKVLESDHYTFSCFSSISGKGICVIVQIDGNRHEEAFEGLEHYYYNKYGIIIDTACKNVSRTRTVSFDPFLFINEDSAIFKEYLPKKREKKYKPVVFVNTDFENVVSELVRKGVNICEDYHDWVSVCFAIISEFGDTDEGKQYFNMLSSVSDKYNEKDCLRQYKNCFKSYSDRKSKKSTIGTIYYHAKLNGIETYSDTTKKVISLTSSKTKHGVSREKIAEELLKFDNIPSEFSEPIINQVISNNIISEHENIIEDVTLFLRSYSLKKNELTRNVEMNGEPIDDFSLNSLFLDCKESIGKVTKDIVSSVIFSNRTESYNPLDEFFNEKKHDSEDTPNLDLLLNSIKSDTPNYKKWVKKWLVSIVASAKGQHSPLCLVLVGEEHGTGKTHFFRYLLPKRLRWLFAESKMDRGKDDEILMTKKLIILDDEYGGRSKREEKKLKEITSKEFINVREPYGKIHVDLRRLAVFCGTANDKQILNDATGNRRVLPVNVLKIEHDLYNACDKEELLRELLYLYENGFDWQVLGEDIRELNDNTVSYAASSREEELIMQKIYSPEEGMFGEWLTITEIINYLISDTKYNTLNNVRVGIILSKMKFAKRQKRVGGIPANVYYIGKLGENTSEVPF